MAKGKKKKTGISTSTVVLGVGAAALGAGVYIFATRKEQDSIYNKILLAMGKDPLPTTANVVDNSTPTTPASTNTSSNNITDYRTLYSRSPKDLYIEALQKFLNEKANAGLVVDAQYGGKTTAAVNDYLAKEKITTSELAKRVAEWDGKVSSSTAVMPSGSFSFPTSYMDGKKYDSVKALQAKLNSLGFRDYENKALAEDGIIGYRTGSAMFKAGFKPFETVRAGLVNFISVAKLPITQETYNKFLGSGLGQINANDVIVIGDRAIIYDTNNQPQKHYIQNAQGQYEQRIFAERGTILGKIQGSDELSYLFITAEGKLRKVRKSQAALAVQA
jgi:peptidoglycan hydrolase-like protein with peptidoglycan-binding domain